jgi:6-phosphogluconate dehydrogenase
MSALADIGLIGLAVMGRNLALNIAEHGFHIAVFNRTAQTTEAFLAEAKGRMKISGATTLQALVASLKTPRAVILMVKAGDPVDEQIGALVPLLSKGDIVIDAGNSSWRDTVRRERALAAVGIQFMGIGVSGGEEGARRGPSIMPGGTREAFARVEPVLTAIAAKANGIPCCAYIGPNGAGHYVKMVHNGIEYADMQLIAEAYFLLRHVAGLDYPALAAVFKRWNAGDLDSFLMQITSEILARTDRATGKPMVEVILDRAGQKGTGAWTAESALALGVPAPTIAEAVFARSISGLKSERGAASELPGPVEKPKIDRERFVAQIGQALYAAKITAYAQGFALLAEASREMKWELDLGRIALLWRAGCIIRARFLDRIAEAYGRDRQLKNLMLDAYFRAGLDAANGAWRRVVATAAEQGCPAPAFASSLAYYDAYRTGTLWANLIQAQRDFFGAHSYERTDRPGRFHLDWASGEEKPV